MQTLFLVLHLIVSVILIFVVMAQEGKDPGMRGIQGASSDMGDSFFKKNGGTTKEAMFYCNSFPYNNNSSCYFRRIIK